MSLAACADEIATHVTARPLSPWNGVVDIQVGLSCVSNELVNIVCSFAATNGATGAALPVTHVRQVGRDTGSGTSWTRNFIWDAVADLGEVKIDDVALAVEAKNLGGVQLWENGPYWAECNVGASKPEECGYYFWWGDTVGYKRYELFADWNSWVWMPANGDKSISFNEESCPTHGKSIQQLQQAGFIDAASNLVAACDAATAHLGAPWRMPTDAEFAALVSNCTTTWTTNNGVSGRLVTGKGTYASRSIFIPAAGIGMDTKFYFFGSTGYYWSSTPDPDWSSTLYSNMPVVGDCLTISSGAYGFGRGGAPRKNGLTVRPLRVVAR